MNNTSATSRRRSSPVISSAPTKAAARQIRRLQNPECLPAVGDAQELLVNLRGVSRAISEIVVALGTEESSPPEQSAGFNPRQNREVMLGRAIRHYKDPETKQGLLFVAQSEDEFGAKLGSYIVRGTEEISTSRRIIIPTDRRLKALAKDNSPGHWNDNTIHAIYSEDEALNFIFPFQKVGPENQSPQRYAHLLASMSSTLLKVTGLQDTIG